MTTDLSTLPIQALSQRVASIEEQRRTITDAFDFLFHGFFLSVRPWPQSR